MNNDFWVLLFDGNNWISYASSESRIKAKEYARTAKAANPDCVVKITLMLEEI